MLKILGDNELKFILLLHGIKELKEKNKYNNIYFKEQNEKFVIHILFESLVPLIRKF